MVWILLKLLLVTLRLVGDPRRDLVLENLALRHQLAVCLRARPPQLQDCDRRFWSSLAKSWTGWRDALVLVQPETVVRCAWAEEAVGSIKEPEEVADMVADGIRDERFLILTDPLAQEWMDGKTANVDRWVGGMNKLQRRIEERVVSAYSDGSKWVWVRTEPTRWNGFVYSAIMAPAGADFPELINWMREEDKIGDLDEPEYREIAGGLDLAFLTQLFTDPVRTADGMKAIVHIGEVVNEFFLSKTSQVWCRRPGILPTMCSCARDWFREIDFGDEIGVKEFPGPPYRLSVTPAEIGPPPRLGEHNEEVLSSLQAAQGQERTMTKRPLAGIRVADFSWFAAGPIAGQTLATFGAEVVRVESETKIDSLRVVQPVALNEDGTPKSSYNASGYFNNFNAAKLGMQLNVNSEKGQEIAHRLIAQCDIFLTNFTPGVVERWQLSYEKLREVNPGIIAVYSPMQGLEGPHKDFLGFGAVLTPVIGINELSGFAHQPPIGVGTNYPDYCVNPGHTTTAILSAIRHKRRTGEGQLIELSQVESVVNALGSAVPNYLATGEIETRTGNRSRIAVPHGAFRCLDDEESVNSTDRWVTIACRDDLEWSATCAAFEQDSVATDDRFSTVEARRANEDELEELISSWTKDRRAEDVMNMLQQAGVPSGVVQTSQDILDRDPHMQTRGFYQYMEHAETGVSAYDGPAAKLSLTPGYHSAPAPLLGEHTQDVCQRILGLSEDEIADLIVEGVLT